MLRRNTSKNIITSLENYTKNKILQIVYTISTNQIADLLSKFLPVTSYNNILKKIQQLSDSEGMSENNYFSESA